MSVRLVNLGARHELTFEDLKGMKAQGYIRDSTEDQRDGFGPELQRKGIENFAKTHGLVLGDAWYTDFITGTSTLKRSGFHKALLGAQLNDFDVLLIYHTSRFARNRSDAIRYKAELKKLGKVLIFVSQNIISGRNTDFLSEGMNEVFDEHYSRSLSGWVTEGLFTKHDNQIANGKPPLGYKSEKYENGKHEVKVPDLKGRDGDTKKGSIETLRYLLTEYSTGLYSYDSLAEHMTMCGYRTRLGQPFTKGGVEVVLANRFYEGKAVFHPGKPDEDVREGKQEVPGDIKSLWLECQKVKHTRSFHPVGRPRAEKRYYPFSKVSVCDECGRHYGGQPVLKKSGQVVRRLYHSRPFCKIEPHSIRVETLLAQFYKDVLPYLKIDKEFRKMIFNSLPTGAGSSLNDSPRNMIDKALKNLRKQHLWGDLTDEEYRNEKRELERQTNSLPQTIIPSDLVNLDRVTQLLSDFPSFWEQSAVTDEQREAMINEVFEETRLRGPRLVAFTPKSEYQALFAYIVTEGVRNPRGEWIRTTDLSVPNAAR